MTDTIYTIPSNTLIQKVGEESVLLNLDSGRYYGLDEVGARMLELLREYGAAEAVIGTMMEEYEVTREQLQHDLDDLLGKLEEHGLVQRRP